MPSSRTSLKIWTTLTCRSVRSVSQPKKSDPNTAPAYIGGGTRVENGRLIVSSVRRGTPAIDAGLNVDDELIAIDDVRVRADGFPARLAQYRPGDKVTLTVARRERIMKLDVTLGADPQRPWRLEPAPNATAEQKARFETLMTGK